MGRAVSHRDVARREPGVEQVRPDQGRGLRYRGVAERRAGVVDALSEGTDPAHIVVGQKGRAGVDLTGVRDDRDRHEVLRGLVSENGVDEILRGDLEVWQAVVGVHRVRQVEDEGDLDVLDRLLRLTAGRRGHLVDADHSHEDRRHNGEGVGGDLPRAVAFDDAHRLEVLRDARLFEVVADDCLGVERLLEVGGGKDRAVERVLKLYPGVFRAHDVHGHAGNSQHEDEDQHPEEYHRAVFLASERLELLLAAFHAANQSVETDHHHVFTLFPERVRITPHSRPLHRRQHRIGAPRCGQNWANGAATDRKRRNRFTNHPPWSALFSFRIRMRHLLLPAPAAVGRSSQVKVL